MVGCDMALEIRQILSGGFDQNFSYVLCDRDSCRCALVDPCGDAELIRRALQEFPAYKASYILLTHGHGDHRDALEFVRSFFPAPVAAHRLCGAVRKDLALEDGMELELGGSSLRVIHTPGHTPESVCFYSAQPEALFSGDTLFVGCCGYCEGRTLFCSLQEKICLLPDETILYSGHDYGELPFDTLGNQKKVNPYLYLKEEKAFLKALEDL